jgi:hypothetical protein
MTEDSTNPDQLEPNELSSEPSEDEPPEPDKPEDPTPTPSTAVALAVTIPAPLLPAGFDYDALGPELAQATRARVASIHEHHRRVLDSVFVIAMEGVGLRDSLPYGVFMQIVTAEYGSGYWNTLNRCINVYERLGDDRFRILRNLRLNDTTLYAMAMKSTPEWVRCEIADGIKSGAIPTDKTLDAEIKRRIDEARHAGYMPQIPSTVDPAQARQLQRRDYALAAVRILKARLPPQELVQLNGWISRAGPEFDRVRLAQKPEYRLGFVSGDVPIGKDGLPLPDKELEDYELNRVQHHP